MLSRFLRQSTPLLLTLALFNGFVPTGGPSTAWADKATASVDSALPKASPNWEESRFSRQTNFAFPDKDWWSVFGDEHLNGYIQQALENNPDINAARIRIEEADAHLKESTASLFPSLSVSPSYNRIGLPKSATGQLPLPSTLQIWQLPIQASYELDLFGKNRDSRTSAKRAAEATVFDTRSAEIVLASNVASAYVNLLRADAGLAHAQESLALFERIAELKNSQHKLGLVSYDEVIRADRDRVKAQSDVTAFQKQQAMFAHQLSVLTGTPPKSAENLERATLSDITLPDVTTIGIPSELVTRRPDILAREKRLEQSSIDVHVARKAFLPTINLSATAALASLGFSNWFNWDNFFNTQAASIAQPLFKGGALKAQLTFRKARYREEIENYRSTILTAFKDVEDSLSQLKAAYQDVDNNTQRLNLTRDDLRLRESMYKQGLSPKLEVLQSQAELVQYEQLADQGKADGAIGTISLYKALGGGY